MDTKVSLIVKVLWKIISLMRFRVYMEVNVYKNPTPLGVGVSVLLYLFTVTKVTVIISESSVVILSDIDSYCLNSFEFLVTFVAFGKQRKFLDICQIKRANNIGSLISKR